MPTRFHAEDPGDPVPVHVWPVLPHGAPVWRRRAVAGGHARRDHCQSRGGRAVYPDRPGDGPECAPRSAGGARMSEARPRRQGGDGDG